MKQNKFSFESENLVVDWISFNAKGLTERKNGGIGNIIKTIWRVALPYRKSRSYLVGLVCGFLLLASVRHLVKNKSHTLNIF